jgi:PAS domain S-box-containing protein
MPKLQNTPTRKDPLRLLAAVLILSTMGLMFLFWTIYTTSQNLQKNQQQLITLQSLRGKILYYDALIENSMMMAAHNEALILIDDHTTTQGLDFWREKHSEYRDGLYEAFAKIHLLAPTVLEELTETLNSTTDRLLDLHNTAFLLIEAGLTLEALDVLHGAEYENYKNKFQQTIHLIDTEVGSLIIQTQHKAQKRLLFQLLLSALVLGIIFIFWWVSWFILQRWRRMMDKNAQEREAMLITMEGLREEAEKRRAEQQAIIEVSNDGILTLRNNGAILSCNPAGLAIFGKETGVIGAHLQDLIPSLATVLDEPFSTSSYYAKIGSEQAEYDVWLDEETVRPIELSMSEALLEDDVIFTATLRDITPRRAAEEARRETDLARRQSEAKSQFLANMSHELRTPMNGVMGMADLLLRSKLSGEQEDYVRTINKSATALLSVINDILDFSKIEADELTLEPITFNLHELVDDIGDIFAAAAEAKNLNLLVRYRPGTPEHIIGDQTRIRQILSNLVNNAIKFTDRGHVLITVMESAKEQAPNGQIMLSCAVTDTGIGISPEKQKNVFGRFTQADETTSRRFGGTGLGLTICKQLAELMGGDITLTSALSKGSTFTFCAPFTPAAAVEETSQRAEERRQAATSIKGKTIHILDDNALNAFIMEEEITYHGGLASTFDSAEKALETLRVTDEKDLPELILVDYILPGKNGLEFGEILKNDGRYKQIKLIACTSMVMQGDIGKFETAGFDGYLAKPMKSHLMLQMIHAALFREINEKFILTRQTLRQREEENATTASILGFKILVAEDDVVNQKVISKLLSDLGCHPTICGDGMAAVEQAKKDHFDLILMDMQMPRMNGLQATEQIRIDERRAKKDANIIVALTANATKNDRDRCLEAGMNDFLSKPITLDKLKQRLEHWLVHKSKVSPDADLNDVVEEKKKSGKTAPIDLNYLNELTGEDEALTKELIAAYVEGAKESLKKLKEAPISSDPWRKAAHKLKGSSTNLGIVKMGELAAWAEAAAKSEDKDMMLTVINTEWDRLIAFIEEQNLA